MTAQHELNLGLSFTSLHPKLQECFLPAPVPTLVRFGKEDCVYKWTEYPLMSVDPATGQKRVTPWWSNWSDLKIGHTLIPGYAQLRRRYRNVDGSVGRPQEFARARSAVQVQWNQMSGLLKARFKKPVWGFVGRAASQRLYEDQKHPNVLQNVVLIGGDYQLCIPNLSGEWIEKL